MVYEAWSSILKLRLLGLLKFTFSIFCKLISTKVIKKKPNIFCFTQFSFQHNNGTCQKALPRHLHALFFTMAISSFAFPILRKAQFYERSLQEHCTALHVTVPANFLMSGAALNTLGATHTGHTPSELTIAPAAIQPGQQFGAGRCGDFFGNTWTQGKQQLLGKK